MGDWAIGWAGVHKGNVSKAWMMYSWHDGIHKELGEVHCKELLVGGTVWVPVERCLNLVVAAPDRQAGMVADAECLLSNFCLHLHSKHRLVT